MRILAVLFPRFTALDMIGPANCWGLMPDAQIQLPALREGPVKTDFGADIIATHWDRPICRSSLDRSRFRRSRRRPWLCVTVDRQHATSISIHRRLAMQHPVVSRQEWLRRVLNCSLTRSNSRGNGMR